MEKQTIDAASSFVSAEERVRLVHFCARVTKNRDVAEDLALEIRPVILRATKDLCPKI